jgi:hypothetical protein
MTLAHGGKLKYCGNLLQNFNNRKCRFCGKLLQYFYKICPSLHPSKTFLSYSNFLIGRLDFNTTQCYKTFTAVIYKWSNKLECFPWQAIPA